MSILMPEPDYSRGCCRDSEVVSVPGDLYSGPWWESKVPREDAWPEVLVHPGETEWGGDEGSPCKKT